LIINLQYPNRLKYFHQNMLDSPSYFAPIYFDIKGMNSLYLTPPLTPNQASSLQSVGSYVYIYKDRSISLGNPRPRVLVTAKADVNRGCRCQAVSGRSGIYR